MSWSFRQPIGLMRRVAALSCLTALSMLSSQPMIAAPISPENAITAFERCLLNGGNTIGDQGRDTCCTKQSETTRRFCVSCEVGADGTYSQCDIDIYRQPTTTVQPQFSSPSLLGN